MKAAGPESPKAAAPLPEKIEAITAPGPTIALLDRTTDDARVPLPAPALPAAPAPEPVARETVVTRETRAIAGDPLGLRQRPWTPPAEKPPQRAAPEPQTASAAIRQSRTRNRSPGDTRRTSVRIGQVNLEVHAPQPRQAMPPPAPAAAPEPRVRDVAAALHRHYLRAL